MTPAMGSSIAGFGSLSVAQTAAIILCEERVEGWGWRMERGKMLNINIYIYIYIYIYV